MLKHIGPCDQVWHAGDIGTLAVCDELKRHKPLKAVSGNVDGKDIRIEYPEKHRFKCEEVNVLIMHIGGYPGKYTPEARKEFYTDTPDLFICGHSHILKVMYDRKYAFLHINPGACGNYGIHTVKTMVRFTIEGPVIRDLEVIELGKRA